MPRLLFHRGILLSALAFLALSASAQERIVAGKNDTIVNPAFSLIFPARALQNGDHWYLRQDRDSTYCVTIEASRKRRIVFSMHIFINPLLSDSVRQLPNAAIADDFRRQELNGMQVLGVDMGMYTLEEVRQAQDSIGQRLFYTLTYRQMLGSNPLYGRLYISLPADSSNAFLLVAHYAEALLAAEHHPGYQLQQFELFRELLGSIRILLPAQKPPRP